EGSHALCDAWATGQLHDGAPGAGAALMRQIGSRLPDCDSILMAENIDASARVFHLLPRDGARVDDLAIPLDQLTATTGVTAQTRRRLVALAGSGTVSETAAQMFGSNSPIDPSVTWTRSAVSFFQANRFLLGALVRRVLE